MNKKSNKLRFFSFFLMYLCIFCLIPFKAFASEMITINLSSPKINLNIRNNLELKCEVTSVNKLKQGEVYLNQKKIGDLDLTNSNLDKNSYLTYIDCNYNVSNFGDGSYELKVIFKDEKNNVTQMVRNIIKGNMAPLKSGAISKAKIQTYDIMQGRAYITTNKLNSNETYTIKGYANSKNGVLYQFRVKDMSTGNWKTLRGFSESRYCDFTLDKAGQYVIAVDVKDKNSISNVDGTVEKTFNAIEKQTSPGKAKIQTYDIMQGKSYITANKLNSNETYTIKGYANSKNGVLYQFRVKDMSTGNWKTLRRFSESRYCDFTLDKAGQYVIAVDVKDKNSTSNVDGTVEKTFNAIEKQTSPGKAKIQTYDIMQGKSYITTNKLNSNETYTIKGYANSKNGVLYQFRVKNISTGNWKTLRGFSESRYCDFTLDKAGQYVIAVDVKDKNSTSNVDGTVEKTFNAIEKQTSPGKAKIQTYDIMQGKSYITTNKLKPNETYTIKGYANSKNGVLYKFKVKDISTGNWKTLRDFSESRYCDFALDKAGQYIIAVDVKDKNSTSNIDGTVEKTFNATGKQISPGKANIQAFDIMKENSYITSTTLEKGQAYTIKGYASSPNGVLYQFRVKDVSTGKVVTLRAFNQNRYCTWTPNKYGKYIILVDVKDKFSTSVDATKEKAFIIPTHNNTLGKTIMIDPGHGGYDSGAVGPTGVMEKNVTLKVGLKLGRILKNNGINVVYTRTSDNVSWPANESEDLKARVAMAESINPNLYISIHNNSFDLPAAHGTETYYANGSSVGDKVASCVQKELVKATGLYNRDIKTAGYYVLKYTNCPAILTELAFISNPREEQLLNSDWFQEKCAEAIAKGILNSNVIDGNSASHSSSQKKNYLTTNYNVSIDEIVEKQMEDKPAFQVYDNSKGYYEWRYALIKDGQMGYATKYDGSDFVNSKEQYDFIKDKVKEFLDPTNHAYDNYGKYQFAKLNYNNYTNAQDLNNVLKGKGILSNMGQAFIDAGKTNNVSPIYLVSHSLLETGNGTSKLSNGVIVNEKKVYNVYGIHAYDSDPVGSGSKYASEQGWFSVEDAIKGGAKWIASRYINNPKYNQDTLYKMRWNPKNPTDHQYATDIQWAYNQVNNIKRIIDSLKDVNLIFDIPKYK